MTKVRQSPQSMWKFATNSLVLETFNSRLFVFCQFTRDKTSILQAVLFIVRNQTHYCGVISKFKHPNRVGNIVICVQRAQEWGSTQPFGATVLMVKGLENLLFHNLCLLPQKVKDPSTPDLFNFHIKEFVIQPEWENSIQVWTVVKNRAFA